MRTEERLIEFICSAKLDDFPAGALKTIKNQLLAIAGTIVAGATEAGCEEAVRFYRELGGRKEATILVHGGKVPAHDAAFVNAAMARALDFCDSIAPGPHFGAAIIPASLAAAELVGGMKGKDFLASLVVASEVAARLNLSEAAYDGFDPTGICVIFGVASAASRILGLSTEETLNALALAFNRCGGSFQSHIDGSLGVRFVQGWVSQGGLVCARLARKGVTGPKNFLEGIYGYLHLYGRDMFRSEDLLGDIGGRYALEAMVFKKYPSCALTAGPTEMALRLVTEDNISAEDIDRILIAVPPYAYKLVGHKMKIGGNPRVDAQFNIGYCVANAFVRKSSKLEHFEESKVRDRQVLELTNRIEVVPDENMDKRGHTAMDMRVWKRNSRELLRQIDIAPGFPGNPLTDEDHRQRFRDCMDFAGQRIDDDKASKIMSLIEDVAEVTDIRDLVPLLVASARDD